MTKAKHLVRLETPYNVFLERIGFLKRPFLFSVDSCNKKLNNQVENAKILTVAAQIYKSEFDMGLDDFRALARKCINKPEPKARAHSKYRSVDGSGNNLKNPEWGASKCGLKESYFSDTENSTSSAFSFKDHAFHTDITF